jgi:hypothetical protein
MLAVAGAEGLALIRAAMRGMKPTAANATMQKTKASFSASDMADRTPPAILVEGF